MWTATSAALPFLWLAGRPTCCCFDNTTGCLKETLQKRKTRSRQPQLDQIILGDLTHFKSDRLISHACDVTVSCPALLLISCHAQKLLPLGGRRERGRSLVNIPGEVDLLPGCFAKTLIEQMSKSASPTPGNVGSSGDNLCFSKCGSGVRPSAEKPVPSLVQDTHENGHPEWRLELSNCMNCD